MSIVASVREKSRINQPRSSSSTTTHPQPATKPPTNARCSITNANSRIRCRRRLRIRFVQAAARRDNLPRWRAHRDSNSPAHRDETGHARAKGLPLRVGSVSRARAGSGSPQRHSRPQIPRTAQHLTGPPTTTRRRLRSLMFDSLAAARSVSPRRFASMSTATHSGVNFESAATAYPDALTIDCAASLSAPCSPIIVRAHSIGTFANLPLVI